MKEMWFSPSNLHTDKMELYSMYKYNIKNFLWVNAGHIRIL